MRSERWINKNCCIQVNDDLKYDAFDVVDSMQVDKERIWINEGRLDLRQNVRFIFFLWENVRFIYFFDDRISASFFCSKNFQIFFDI